MRIRWATVLVTSTLVLASCSSGGSDAGSDGPTSVDRTPATVEATTTTVKSKPATYAKAECPMEIPESVTVEVECGWLMVPENRTKPDSNTIKLAVARIHSRSKTPKADPVVNLQGGPGFPSLENIEGSAASKILDTRDYVIWDQRGLGFSQPNLNCPETDEAVWGIFATTDSSKEEGARIEDSLKECRARLVADGVDLDGYDTTQNAADLADLRVALGIDEWNLRGVSYGSALAIETMRNHPEGLRSVLLDSVVAPDGPFGAVDRGKSALRSFSEMDDACADQPACKAKYGDVEDLIARAAKSLDDDPYEGNVIDPVSKEVRKIKIIGEDLYAGLFNAMYDEALIPIIPSVMQSIIDGDRKIIDALATDSIPFAAGQYEAMTASVDCADRQRVLDTDAFDPFAKEHPELGALIYISSPELGCERWDVESQPKGFNELLTETKVPTIVMAGRFDPVTPPAGTKRVADALGLELLMFPNAGHGAAGSSDCGRDIWFAFMDDPEAGYPDTSCIDALKPPAFG
jgi:pimeloyl-ACP methyl ester carboxylesterase